MSGFRDHASRALDSIDIEAFQFEQSDDQPPTIKAEGDASPIARFLIKHAHRPHQIEALLLHTDSVLAGRTPCELIKDDYEQLELDGGQYVARATRRDPGTRTEQTAVISLGRFRDLLIEWRAFVLERWQKAPW